VKKYVDYKDSDLCIIWSFKIRTDARLIYFFFLKQNLILNLRFA
jgi:hypothetical protein